MSRDEALTFGPFWLDPRTESVWRDTEEIRFRPKTFAVLKYLAEHPNRLVTKEELLQAVWPEAVVGDAALAVCVGEIRKELGDDARTPRFIETFHRRGYRFIGSVAGAACSLGAGVEAPTPDSPLIGRETELLRLREALDKAWQHRGRVVVICGEAGIGKSRVVEEVAAEAGRRAGRILIGRCYETEQILPFGPWVNAIRNGDVLTQIKGAGALPAAWQAELARLFPELGEPQLPADYAHTRRIFEAMAHLVGRLARQQPLLFVLEDLHWADEMSLRLLAFVARQIQSWSVLVVATARDEELPGSPLLGALLHELVHDDRSLRLTLAPLSRSETMALVRALVSAGRDRPGVESLAEQVWAASEGNPFVVVETMRVVQEGPTADTPSGVPLPERVRDVITARLARLSERGRHLAAVASVIGREFDFAVLARAAGLPEAPAAEGVEELVRRRVLRGPGERFDFTHDRIREVAYRQLLPSRRRLLHAEVATALEDVHRDALEPHYAALAAHYRQGERWEKALSYLRQAGGRAVACSANREAIADFEQALAVLEHLPEGPSKTRQVYDFRILRAAVDYSLGELRRIVDHLDEADALARVLDDQTLVGRVAVLRVGCLSPMGDQTAAIEAGERGLAIAEAVGNLPLQVVATNMLGYAQLGRGDFPRAIALLQRSAGLLEGQPAHKRFGQIGLPSVFWRTWLIFSLGEVGAFPEAITRGKEAVGIAEAADQPFSLAEAHGALGHLYCLKGEPSSGIPALERSVALCRDYELAVISPTMIGALGHAYAVTGCLTEALPTMEEAVAHAASRRLMWWQSRRVAQLGEGYLLADRVNDAVAAAHQALALADAHDERGNRAYALRLRGEVALRRTPADPESAGHHLHQALVLADELGMRPLAARCHLDLGRLSRRAGDRSNAHDHLTVAHARFRDMDMPGWIEQAEAELGELR